MIYTIGRTQNYEAAFRNCTADETPDKLGRSYYYSTSVIDYVGGSVWKTFEEAREYCETGFSVYGVEADWEKDTVKSKDGDWHDLLIDAKLVRLEKR